MLCNTSRTGLPAECHVFTIEPVFPSLCKMWETVQNFVEKHHPNKAVAVRAMNIFNDNAMSHFREILKRRQKQQSLDRFLVKVAWKDSSEPTGDSDSIIAKQ